MPLKSIQFKNFKRFSDLTIDLDPTNSGEIPKLVLLIGTNGSGKSSVFDGFENLNTLFKHNQKNEISSSYYFSNQSNLSYFHKFGNDLYSIKCNFTNNTFYNFEFDKNQGVNIKVETNLTQLPTDTFYGRTAFRYTPKITKKTIGMNSNKNFESDEDRPKSYIETDTHRLDADIDEVFRGFLREIKEKNNAQENFNGKMNSAFKNIFGKIKNPVIYLDFDLPGENGESVKFWFQKGESKIDYDLLSAGEKMIFEILFNLYARKNLYQNSIVFLDEIDLHLNTALQKNLLQEITENWIPDGCQLWTASHSLGFIEYAREYDKGAIIDFDNLDFDEKQVLTPKYFENRSSFLEIIKKYSEDDLKKLKTDIEFTSSFKEIKDLSFEGFFVGWKNKVKTDLKNILENSTYFIVAKKENKVVGFINCISDKVLSAYIPLLEVLPKYQKQGIGEILLIKMMKKLKKLYMIDLVCDKDLNSFYEKYGFKSYNSCIIRNIQTPK